MLTPPTGLSESDLARHIAAGWGIAIRTLDYRPVGFGSHHWAAIDEDGARWFVTVDELDRGRYADHPPRTAFASLRAALITAMSLRAGGASYVAAPIPAASGEPAVVVQQTFALAVYPFIDGTHHAWADFTAEHRDAILDLVVALHGVPATTYPHAVRDDFVIPQRTGLEAALRDRAREDTGPYAARTDALLAEHGRALTELLATYDELVRAVTGQAGRAVLTHGEPHPGNTIGTAGGLLLIDWDTAAVAPPERDLYSLDPGDGSIFAAYAERSGRAVLQEVVELYRIRWDLSEVAEYVGRFRQRHTGTSDDDEAWRCLLQIAAASPA